MVLTEKEAQQKTCPINATTAAIFNSLSKLPHIILDPQCIASGCMMWQWAETQKSIPVIDRKGYCGLAGKPGGGCCGK